MKKIILNKLLNFIKTFYPAYTDKDLRILKYGLEGIYITITKTIIIFSLAYFLKIHKKLFIIVILYNFLRMFSFGLHSQNSNNCLISSCLIFICSVYLCQLIHIAPFLKVFISFVSIVIFIRYSPADTKKRPLINSQKRLFYKFISTSIIIIYSYLLITSKKVFFSNSLFLAMSLQSFLITPFCYSLFNQSYNNFLNWKGGQEC